MDIDKLLQLMINKNGSDLFITADVAPSMKINGKILPVGKTPLTAEQTMRLVKGVMTPSQQKEFDETNECQFAISDQAQQARFRVSAFIQRDMAGMILRKIENKIPTVEELRLPPALKELAMKKRGIILLVGATGTGKSTTLAAMIGHRNQNSHGHIITIEDPIEFVHKHRGCIITQREVGIDTHSFEAGLKNTLRQAPDVILIGEIRDTETMENAIAFAETGHLCLGTLHANNANQTLDRIINFFPEERRNQLLMDLSSNMKAIISQRLIRTEDGKGRRAAVEIMLNTPLMADLILKSNFHEIKALMTKSRELGMQTFDQALFDLYDEGAISYDEAIRNADSANELRLQIKLKSRRGEGDTQSTSELKL